tara:strand:- start:5667 stop:5795 length:129 start_codon:yes stop_codon:yes gene_type:complete
LIYQRINKTQPIYGIYLSEYFLGKIEEGKYKFFEMSDDGGIK